MIDDLRPGQKSISAETLNETIRGGELARKTTTDGGHQVSVPGVGRSVISDRRTQRDDPNTDLWRTVVIKKATPTAGLLAGWVRVQRVQYRDDPPQPCTDSGCRIQTWGDEFDVRPQYGQQTKSYESFEIGAEGIGLDTVFFEARWEDRKWILSAPVGAIPINPVRITSIIGNPLTSERLNVIRVEENEAGSVVDVGGEVEGGYATWYNHFGRHYQQFIGRTPAIILPALYVDGDWRVLQLHRFRASLPAANAGAEICPP